MTFTTTVSSKLGIKPHLNTTRLSNISIQKLHQLKATTTTDQAHTIKLTYLHARVPR